VDVEEPTSTDASLELALVQTWKYVCRT